MNSKSKKIKRTMEGKQSKVYDDKLSQDLAELIEELTHTGEKSLNDAEFKKVKSICKRSDKYVNEAYSMLMEYLAENHAEVRLSAFQMCDEIFRRSHCFREQIIFKLEEVVQLTTGYELPPPHNVARELKRMALRTIHEWNGKFGSNYKKLSLGYNYLREVKKVDYNALDILDAATRARQEEDKRRLEAINAVRIKKVFTEIKEKEDDIKATVTSLSNCINLLLPHPDDFFIAEDGCDDGAQPVLPPAQPHHTLSDDSGSDDESCNAELREVGMLNPTHTVQLEFTPSSEVCIEENPENAAIIESAREYAKLIANKYLPRVKAWLEVLSKSTAHEEDRKKLIELKGELDDALFKFRRITFSSADDVSSDSDLEEVPEPVEMKPAAEPVKTVDSTQWSIMSHEGTDGDPASLQNRPVADKTETAEEPQPSTSSQHTDRKHKLLAVAPKLPFDVDLYHWEDENLPVPTMLPSSTDGHRFWVGAEGCMDELPVPEGSAALRTRVIEFTGKFSPVTHSCKVRLPSGKLCPRRDRHKCPFHGEIVPRDEKGNCIDPKDTMRMQELAEKRQQEKPDWQDPKLLAEIKKSTGIDLKMPEKGKRKKRKKEYPGLTNLKESENTATKRLEKKIFKTSAMRKVAAALDKIDQRKFRDKFGDQFQYFYGS